MKSQSVVECITGYNAGREPERLAMKMLAMRSSATAFLRGTAHMFWQRVLQAGTDSTAPAAWCTADQHLENFGTYRGDNGLVYFDLNDFDEAALAPCNWEMLRLLTSLLVAAPTLDLPKAEARALGHQAAEAYLSELALGKARWIERRTATGAIDELMTRLKKRDQRRLLDRRTIQRKGVRKLDPEHPRLLPVDAADREALAALTEKLGHDVGDRQYFSLIDCARRIAGTGSLGLQRFVLLIRGDGTLDGHALLDLKFAQASSMVAVPGIRQPDWKDDAERIVTVQRRCQAIAPGQLRAMDFRSKPFVLRELQPAADRLNLAAIAADEKVMTETVRTMGQLVAWSQLRSSGRGGAANADDLVGFAATHPGRAADNLVTTARGLAAVVLDDYAAYCRTYDAEHATKAAR